eukprot:CAMPEP_0167789224 /NCGR_PEP_ID=MMETSP0111_2-20121227/10550_1 /TAXON_ID=91324 /ORGANISM="Lotharella globosa, Strain CCCM811" /LENGTH=313 /DNA_ID=CAMNT_0007681335 /DNA_START=19 /DNA_END=960 /DNA_ORIENTATION=+
MAFVAVVLLTLHAVSAATLSTRTSPAFFWSGQMQFTGHHTVSGPMSSVDVEEYARDIVVQKKESQMLHPDHVSTISPEVFLSVTFKKASTKFLTDLVGSFDSKTPSILENLIRSSSSSLAFSRVSLDGKYRSFASIIATHMVPKAQRAEYEIDGSHDSCNKILESLDGKTDLFSNSKTDMVSVTFIANDKQANEQCLKKLNDKVADLSNGKYVSFLAADSVEPITVAFPTGGRRHASFAGHSSKLHHRVRTLATATTGEPGTGLIEYITPQIFIGVLFSLLLLSFIYIGVIAMMSIYVPMRFEKRKFKIGKIY